MLRIAAAFHHDQGHDQHGAGECEGYGQKLFHTQMMTILPAHPEKIISFWQRQLMTVFGQTFRSGTTSAIFQTEFTELSEFCSSGPICLTRRAAGLGLNPGHNSESGCFSPVKLK
jgi:hypothetical protein